MTEVKEYIIDPRDIVKELNKYIIGQDTAKRAIALLMLNKSILRFVKSKDIKLITPIKKLNLLMIGPTGTGKTAFMKALEEISGLPIPIFDVTSITSAGYVGAKIEDILELLVNRCFDYTEYKMLDISDKAVRKEIFFDMVQNGIVYLDEIDKIYQRDTGLDITGDSVQNELLKLLDGGTVYFGNGGHRKTLPKGNITSVCTDDISFVLGGAFQGLSDIIGKRLTKNSGIGFNANLEVISKMEIDKDSLLKHVTPEDLVTYGFKPEFLGRIPIIVGLNPLTEKVIKEIILNSKNSVFYQYQTLLGLFEIKVEITESAITEIAHLAKESTSGARALQPIFFKLFEDILYNIWDFSPGDFLTITKHDVNKIRDKL